MLICIFSMTSDAELPLCCCAWMGEFEGWKEGPAWSMAGKGQVLRAPGPQCQHAQSGSPGRGSGRWQGIQFTLELCVSQLWDP